MQELAFISGYSYVRGMQNITTYNHKRQSSVTFTFTLKSPYTIACISSTTQHSVEVKAKRSVGDYQDAIQGHFEAMTRYKMFQVDKLLEQECI